MGRVISNSMRPLLNGPLILVGNRGGTHVAQSLLRSAQNLGIETAFCDVAHASSSLRIVNALAWQLRQKRPPHIARLRREMMTLLEKVRPAALITTGLAPVSEDIISTYQRNGAVCAHISTDDPWNPNHKADWYHRALKAYDIVFTPRLRNLGDFRALPCRKIRYLPFGFDPTLAESAPADPSVSVDALFVGGADPDRAAFFRAYVAAGGAVSLVGAYWDRFPLLKSLSLGIRTPSEVATLTRAAKVNICLVRQANRDGHVMRSFEAAAIGCCMLVEETPEHREIFGPDGECVLYFRKPIEAALLLNEILVNPAERKRLASSVQRRILAGGNTYTDRLISILSEIRGDTPEPING